LYHKNICPAHVFENLDVAFSITEARDRGFAALHAQKGTNLVCQRFVGSAAKDLEFIVMTPTLSFMLFGLRLLLFAFSFRSCCYRGHSFSPVRSWFATTDSCELGSLVSPRKTLLVSGWAARIRT